jgi:amino acid adenylation domain-containing protein
MLNNVIEGFKLSPQQERLWILQQTSVPTTEQAQCAILIEGQLDSHALKSALREVVSRHEILRTAFERLPGMATPLQVITNGSVRMGEKIELIGLSKKLQEERIEAELRRLEEENRGRAGLNAELVMLGQNRHMLLVSLPALCSDGPGMENLIKEICRLYACALRGELLSSETTRYAIISEWLNELLESEQAKAGRDYWRKHDLPSLISLGLPYRSRNSVGAEVEPKVICEAITRDSFERIERISQQYGASVSEFLLACWKILLWRLIAHADITVGVTYDGRTDEELKETLGLFAKRLPIQTRLEDNLKYVTVLMQVAESLREAYEWQECFAWRHISGLEEKNQPLQFPFGFEFEVWPQKISIDDAEFSVYRKLVQLDRPTLNLCCVKVQDCLVTEFHYDAHSYSEKRIRRLAGEFQALIESLLRNLDCRISELNILSDAERESLLGLSEAETDLSLDYIHKRFERQAERVPDNTALVFGDVQLTYAKLNTRSNRVAHYLRRLGVKPGVVVAICVDRSIEMAVGLLGILKAGGAYLPLDPNYPEKRLTFMLEDSQATILLTQRGLAANLSGHNAAVVHLDEALAAPAQESEANLNIEATIDSLAYVIYTSGSTGNPKGAMLTHGGIVNCLRWMQATYSLDATDRFLMRTSLNFDPSVWELFWPLSVGGCVVLAETLRHYDTAYLTQLIAERGVTSAYFVPSMLRAFLDEPRLDASQSLRRVICGGESLSIKTMGHFFDKLHAELHHSYGPTETSIAATEWTCRRERERGIAPIGKPLGNVQVYILDPIMNLAPMGVPGELYIGGACVGRGYLNRPGLTAERFVPNPFGRQSGERMYRTGDLVRWGEDEELEFLERIDYQVKIRGHRIELGEIEAALNSHSGVRQSVIATPEDGSGDKRLVGYVVGDAGTTARELKKHLRERLPDYMVPEAIVVLEEMPLTANGKIDRARLASVKNAERQSEREYIGPQTPVEEILIGIFQEILKLGEVSRSDNFFEIGGHSLLAIRVVSRVRNTFGVEIEVRSVFENATIEALGRRIEEAMRAGEKDQAPPLVKVERENQRGAPLIRLPLSFAQQRLWFIDQLDPGNAAYNIPGAVRLEGKFDLDALEYVMNEIVRRHEILRTRFEVVEAEPIQVIEKWEPRRLDVKDLTSLTYEEKNEEATRIAREEAKTGFDLGLGPLLRVKALKLAEEQHVLLFTMHHIVSDGWSMDVLIREVGALYRAYRARDPSPLKELPVQYADFALWQREWLQGEALEKELSYWRKQLAGVEALKLPTDHPRPAVASYRGASQSFLLDPDLASALRELSRQQGVTLFVTLMAAFQTLLYRYTGQEDIAVGTPVANRDRLELEGLIGYFVNTLVMRTQLSSDLSFRELLHRVRDTALAAYSHAQLPFEKLVVELSPKRAIGQNPLFQVWFFLDNAVSSNDPVFPEVTISSVKSDFSPAKLDLALTMTASSNGIAGGFTYAADLFEPRSIITLVDRFQSLLQAMVRDPNRKLFDIPLLDLDGNRQLIETEITGRIDETRASFNF